MSFEAVCQSCEATYQLGDQYRGKQLRCKKCQEIFTARPIAPPPARPAKGIAREPVKPAPVRTRPRADDFDDDLPTPRRRSDVEKTAPQAGVPKLWIGLGIGAGVFIILLLGVIVLLLISPSQHPQPVAAVAQPVQQIAQPVQQIAQPAPAAVVAKPADEPAANPPVSATPSPSGQLSGEALKNLKAATVFIKVEADRELSCSGSGFLVRITGDTGYVVTNHHVVNPEAERLVVGGSPGRRGVSPRVVKVKATLTNITAVFNSGAKTEQAVHAEVVATDESRDLAVLKVQGLREWPRPISLEQKATLVETMPIYILGFPFGEGLSLKKGNPGITINKGTVSSLRENEFGQMKAVQIDGAINPGNSGGPVVDADGHLVGISVATIVGTGIGLAIAPDELARMFLGRVGAIALTQRRLDATQAEYDVTMSFIDPDGKIQSAAMLYMVSKSPAQKLQHKADGNFDPLPNTQRLELQLANSKATGNLAVAKQGTEPQFLVYQSCYVNGAGETIYTQALSQPLQQTSVVRAPSGAMPNAGEGAPIIREPQIVESNDPLGGGQQKFGDLTMDEIKVNAAQLSNTICWSQDGKSFYCLDKTGIVRLIALDGYKEKVRADVGTVCSSMALSAEGVVVVVQGKQEVQLLDPVTLKTKLQISVPQARTVAASPRASIAFVPGMGILSAIDLKTGEIAKQYQANEIGALPFSTIQLIKMSPDGKYLFLVGGIEQLLRFRVDGSNLVVEEKSDRIAQNGQEIEISQDSKFVCLPSGGGNYGSKVPYSTFIYRVGNLRSPVMTIPSGAYPKRVAIDAKRNSVFAQNHDSQLLVFNEKGIKLKDYKIPDAGSTTQILAHPDGSKLLLLTDKKLFLVSLKSK